MLARFLSSISSFCFIYALTPLFEFLRYFGFPNTLLWSSFAWLNLWDFVRTFLDRASDCVSRVLLVPIVVLSYAVLILFVRGALGESGLFSSVFQIEFEAPIHPPLWSPVRSFNWYQSQVEVFSTLTGSKTTWRPWRVSVPQDWGTPSCCV